MCFFSIYLFGPGLWLLARFRGDGAHTRHPVFRLVWITAMALMMGGLARRHTDVIA
jgi:hypothetical protein